MSFPSNLGINASIDLMYVNNELKEKRVDTRKRGALIAAALLILVMVVGFVGYGMLSGKGKAQNEVPQNKTTASEVSPVKETPSLMLKDYDATVYTDAQEQVSLTQIAAGKPLVINFWATWCPYCIEEMPDYQRLYNEYADRVSFAFIDQTDGNRETVAMAQAWLQENGYAELPAYYDTELDASSTFGARSLPTTIVVSADGQIVSATAGMIDAAAMRSLLDTLA